MSERLRVVHAARFTLAYRLRQKAEFDRAYKQGKRSSNEHFTLVTIGSSLTHPRLGLAISAKAVGNAVARNRIKRIIRESFRQNLARLPNMDLVIGARSAVQTATNAHLFRSLDQLWDKLARHA